MSAKVLISTFAAKLIGNTHNKQQIGLSALNLINES